ncbi:MAG: hypothetical protein LBT05_00955 [Planctomycetaceae bacterium]|jgi:hypothetical protein|nr:hypothetical protein [Planctomycetaceae bacterium]
MATKLESESSKVPFFLVEKGQESPSGYIYIDGNVLVVEFAHANTSIKIQQADARQFIEIIDDTSIQLERPDKRGASAQLFFPVNGQGRFLICAIQSWMGSDGTEKNVARKKQFLARFESFGAKCAALWQLILPYVLFGITFLLDALFPEILLPELKTFSNAWHIIPTSPIIAAHYILFLIPGLAVLVFSRVWGLRILFYLSLLTTLTLVGIGFLAPQLLENLVAAEPNTILPGYWLITTPYFAFLMAPAFYYFVVWRRQ